MSFPVPARRRWPLVVTGLVAGLVLGAAAVGIPWALAGDGSSGNADVAAACGAIARTGDLDPSANIANLRRWSAAAELVAADAETDPSLKPLSQTLRAPVDIVQATFRAGGPEYTAAMAKARQSCATATS